MLIKMPGSDKYINYQLRPAKSVERKMICSLIRQIQLSGGLTDFRYIGMGAKYFVDFMLIHHQFGTRNMISIEAQKELKQRYDFNKPLGFIEMKYGTSTEILPQIEKWEEQNNLIWLDYDGAFTDAVLDDIETVSRNCKEGDMLILTVNASCKGTNKTDKREEFQKAVGKYYDPNIPMEKYTNNGIASIEIDLIKKQLDKVLTKRNNYYDINLESLQLLNIIYKDSSPMLTFGTVFVDGELRNKIDYSSLKSIFPFVSNSDEPYKLEVPSLTNKEIQLLLKNFPFDYAGYDANDYYGIELEEIQEFEKIYRYYPYYSEGGYIN